MLFKGVKLLISLKDEIWVDDGFMLVFELIIYYY